MQAITTTTTSMQDDGEDLQQQEEEATVTEERASADPQPVNTTSADSVFSGEMEESSPSASPPLQTRSFDDEEASWRSERRRSSSSSSSESTNSIVTSDMFIQDVLRSVEASSPHINTRRQRMCWRMLCWPILLPLLLLVMILFLIFCALPVMLFIFVATALYYCCASNPIPPAVFWHAVWHENGNGDNDLHPRAPQRVWTHAELKERIQRRVLLERGTDVDISELGEKGVLIVTGGDETLVFSAPLEGSLEAPPVEDGKTNSHQQSETKAFNQLDAGDQLCKTDGGLVGEEQHRGLSCDICLLDYEPHDIVAWSRNSACDHAYHEDCIVDWLTRKPTCPSCRQCYIFES